jgi:sigma-54 specific flagellar transcriptional regulator A
MKTALLVIDDEPERAGELCLLLRFLEEAQVARAEFLQLDRTHTWKTTPICAASFLAAMPAGTTDQPPLAALHAIRAAGPPRQL